MRYWACEASGGAFVASREVDELWWGRLPEALSRLAPDRDRRILEQFAADTRRTRALVVVRHASAGDKRGLAGRGRRPPAGRRGRGAVR